MQTLYNKLESKKISLSFTLCSNFIFGFLILFSFIFSNKIIAQTDTCANPPSITIGNSCTTTNYSILGSWNDDGPNPCNGNSRRDGWFIFTTGPSTTSITISGTSNQKLGLGVYTGNVCGSLTEIACTVPNNANASVSLNVTTNTTYKLRLMRTNNNGNNNMDGTICITDNYCTPSSSSSAAYISGITSIGTIIDNSNKPTTYSTGGYGNFSNTTIATQVPNGGINIEINLVGSQFIICYVDWNRDGDFVDSGEQVYTTGNTSTGDTSFGFIVPAAAIAGNYRMRIRTYEFQPPLCTLCQAIVPCGVLISGETEDYTIAVIADCPAKILTVTDGFTCGTGTVNLNVTATSGTTQYRWYTSATGGSLVASVNTTAWTSPSIATTTNYYVTAFNGSCESLVRTQVTAVIFPLASINFTPAAPTVCGENSIITIAANSGVETLTLFNEKFEGGLGLFNVSTTTNTNGGADSSWSVKTSTYQPTTTTVWKPAINSNVIGNKFAFTTSDYNSNNLVTNLALTTGVNTNSYTSLSLSFRQYYSDYSSDTANIEVSSNGGTWTTVQSYNSDLGSASQFITSTVDLSAYINITDLKIRFRYAATWADGWGIDDIKLSGTKLLNPTYTWSGASVSVYTDAACTVPYTNQSVAQIYARPTYAQLQTGATFTLTASASLGNGCTVSKDIIINNNTKIWKTGGTTDWNTASNWLPAGVPTSTNCVIIAERSVISGSGYNAYAYNLNVKNAPGILDILSLNSLTVTDKVTVDNGGTFNIENNASLIQVNNVVNVGNVNSKRNAQIATELDYVYWSSPVGGNTAAGTVVINNIASPSLRRIYQWQTTGSTANGANMGNGTGTYIGSDGNTMALASGYLAQPSDGFTGTLNAKFTGIPNNGNIPFTISRGSYTGEDYMGTNGAKITNLSDNYNLVGNPYPSSISTNNFLYNNNALLQDGIKVWKHGTAISSSQSSPYYGTYQYNYSPNDFLIYNYTGGTVPTPGAADYFIGSGQSFFVTMKDGAATTGTINFDNSLRNATYSNSQFYRSESIPVNNAFSDAEKHRIWLDFSGANQSQQSLVGYIEGATNEKDDLYDATFSETTDAIALYSLINKNKMVIQGKSLPFNQEDTIPMGYNAITAGEYKIGILAVDGLFSENQKIYLEDKLLNVIHDLTIEPYAFNTEKGTIDNRFILRYNNSALGTAQFEVNNGIKIITNDQAIVYSSNKNIQNIVIFDLLGRKIDEYDAINSPQFTLKNLNKTSTTLIMKVTLDDGIVVSQKFVF